MARTYRVLNMGIPLTKEIHSEERAQLAYNVLRGMMENGVTIEADNGKELMWDSQFTIKDNAGNGIKLKPDPEFFGTEAEKEKIRVNTINRQREENGTFDDLDNDYEPMKYGVYIGGADGDAYGVVPLTYDPNKAKDMADMVMYDMNPDILFYNEDGMALMMDDSLVADDKWACEPELNYNKEQANEDTMSLTDEDLKGLNGKIENMEM